MLAKWWKKIGLLILIIACIYNVMNKIVNRLSFDEQIDSTVTYYNVVLNEVEQNNTVNNNSNVSVYN